MSRIVKNRLSAAAFTVAIALFSSVAYAIAISVDFNNTTNSSWVLSPAVIAGPLGTANWNSTSTASGSGKALVDNSGKATGATLTWSSSTVWGNGDGNASPDRILLNRYLDDGSGGIRITVSNVPYSMYDVYLIFASDQNGNNSTYTTRDFAVNGTWVLGTLINGNGAAAATATAFGDWDKASSQWVQLTGSGTGSQTRIGNYAMYRTTGSTLTISGQQYSSVQRGSLAGFMIVPEPGTLVLSGGGLLALFLRRRRRLALSSVEGN